MKIIQSVIALLFAAVLLAVSPFAVAHQSVPPFLSIAEAHKKFPSSYPLHHAVVHNDIAEVKRLLANGAEVNVKAHGGLTPLYVAAVLGEGLSRRLEDITEMVELLLDNGAHIDEQNNRGWTALHAMLARDVRQAGEFDGISWWRLRKKSQYRVFWGNTQKVVALLLDNGADINAKGPERETALHRAMWWNFQQTDKWLVTNEWGGKGDKNPYSLQYAEALIANGVNVNSKDKHCMTALHYAVSRRETEWVKFLLANGADPEISNCEFNTAWDLAKGKRKMEFLLNQWFEEWKATQ